MCSEKKMGEALKLSAFDRSVARPEHRAPLASARSNLVRCYLVIAATCQSSFHSQLQQAPECHCVLFATFEKQAKRNRKVLTHIRVGVGGACKACRTASKEGVR